VKFWKQGPSLERHYTTDRLATVVQW